MPCCIHFSAKHNEPTTAACALLCVCSSACSPPKWSRLAQLSYLYLPQSPPLDSLGNLPSCPHSAATAYHFCPGLRNAVRSNCWHNTYPFISIFHIHLVACSLGESKRLTCLCGRASWGGGTPYSLPLYFPCHYIISVIKSCKNVPVLSALLLVLPKELLLNNFHIRRSLPVLITLSCLKHTLYLWDLSTCKGTICCSRNYAVYIYTLK